MNQDDSYAYDEKQLMKALYGSKAKVVKDIRAWIDGNNKRTYLRKCPYCTISRANTTEHILPKENTQNLPLMLSTYFLVVQIVILRRVIK